MNRLLFGLFVPFAFCFATNVKAQDTTSHAISADSMPLVKKNTVIELDSLQQAFAAANTFDSSVQVMPATTKTPIVSKPLSLRSVVIPSALIGYGAYTFANKDLKSLNLHIRREVWEERDHQHFGADDFTFAAPVIAVYALNLAGVKGKHNFVDRTALYGMSYLIGSSVVGAVKRMSGVVRPDSSNFKSFPSGHTAQAFIAAEFMRQEYKDKSPWYGFAAYAIAAGTGYLRMYNNKHWFNDVLAGAGVGILSTRVSYWLYPKIKNLIVKDKNKEINTVVMPMYQQGAVGIGLVHRFK